MNCPACKSNMSEKDFGGVSVNVCDSCKGIWFDWMELTKLDHQNQGVGQALQDALHSPRVNDANRPPLNCPKCNLPMHKHEFKYDKEVNVDECYACGGFFLDSGELEEIRDHSMSEQEEDAYFEKMASNLPANQKMQRDTAKDQLREDAIRHYTRFLRLSYYRTGK